jgi:hypothetical protein
LDKYVNIGNYLHYIISGHIRTYLEIYNKCLSKYQQQSWELLNKEVSLAFTHQSNKGGGRHGIHPVEIVMKKAKRKLMNALAKWHKEIHGNDNYLEYCSLCKINEERISNSSMETDDSSSSDSSIVVHSNNETLHQLINSEDDKVDVVMIGMIGLEL